MLQVWISRSTDMRYIKSIGYIILSYDKTLTSNPSTQIIIRSNMDKKTIRAAGGGCKSWDRDNQFLHYKFRWTKRGNSSRLICHTGQIFLY